MLPLRPLYIALLGALLCAAGCNGPQKTAQAPDIKDVQQTGVKEIVAEGGDLPDPDAPDPPPPPGISLFDAKKEIQAVPFAWDLSRDGTMLMGQAQYMEQNLMAAVRWHLKPSGADQPMMVAKTAESLIKFIAASPDGGEALLATLGEYRKTRLADNFWRSTGVDPGMPSGNALQPVPYIDSAKLPESLAPDALEKIPAFYSWDGKKIIMPVKLSGIIVADIASGKARYAEFPSLDGIPATDSEAGVLPDQNGKHLVYASLYAIVSGADVCQVRILDTDTMEWSPAVRFDWVVSQVGGDDLEHKPWVVLGSRAKQVTSEPGRVPRLALYHQDTDQVQELPTFGDVVWNRHEDFRLDPHGEYLVYMDNRRKGVVRLELATGKLDLDPRWFARHAQLLVDEHASTVVVIEDNTVMRANWTEHEDVPGYAAK